uniref:Disease resistance protein At4g27190-like leucine-rich repeats domain-containing protein n=1 Tax=Solanum lycopersicum TaxID=4081 RepID=A0A3Q7IHK6_SOLLC
MEIRMFYEEEAWILFKKKVGIFVDNLSLLDIAKEVDKECKGLPLVIITVAGALKNLKTKPSWVCALEQLKSVETRIIPEVTKELYKPLSLSYDLLECNEAKNLFFLCSLFEEDSYVFPEELLRYGRGFASFQKSESSDKNYVKMHDVVRDVAISIVSEGEHNFMDDFFDGMDKLNVFSLSVYRQYHVLPLPKSIRRLSSLTTLCLSNLVLGDISIIGNILRNGCKTIERISTGALSRLVQLEELYMVVVEYCSYSTLSELKSLSRLTALTLSKCVEDVIYSNLSLSSKWTRYNLTVSDMWTSIMDDYDRNITLEVMETSDNVEAIKFPQLRKMIFDELPKFQNFWPTTNNSITISNPLFHEKVSCLNLKELDIYSSNISSLCSHQLPIAYFSKLEILEVKNCRKLRNLISPSVTRVAWNLRIQLIENCMSMEKVITQEEQQGEEIMNDELLFPLDVKIDDCPVIKTLSVSTVSLAWVNYDDRVELDDLNECIQQRFNSKEQTASKGTNESDESEANDGDKFEAADDSEGRCMCL